MGTKRNPGKFDCMAKALPDEPTFTLLARDAAAPEIVDLWATIRETMIENGDKPPFDVALISEARQCARDMIVWRGSWNGAWRDTVVGEFDHLDNDALAAMRNRIGLELEARYEKVQPAIEL